MEFASDNTSGAAPQIMQALMRANEGFAPAYGREPAMDRVRALVRDIFEAPNAEIFLVANGTTANALSIATFCPPWGAIFCHEQAHVQVDECGAPEFFVSGGKMVPVPGEHGKIDPDDLARAIATVPQGDVHSVQRGMVTLTNTTEAGTVYTPDEIAALCEVARGFRLPVHLDGARLANALVASGASPADMTWRAGIDVLSLGATKNGCLAVDAVVLFDPEKAWEVELRRKRAGHLFSKHRFLSAQIEAYLTDGLWLELARAANDRAVALERALAALPGARIVHPRQANMVFASLPRAIHRRAMSAGAHYYLWPHWASLEGPADEAVTARFVCSWNTNDADIVALERVMRGQD